MKYSRKSFLKLAGLSAVAAGTPIFHTQSKVKSPKSKKATKFKLGLASYSLRNYDLDELITIVKRVGLENIGFKSMHMPMDASNSELKVTAEKMKKNGLSLYGAGVIYMKTEEEVENTFRYAKASGLSVIIGVPNHELLPLVDKKVKETGVKVAIHNHGPGDDLYPSPESVYEKVKSLDKGIGLCIDIGHTIRIGLDPAENIIKYADRLYDLHMKDVDKAEADGKNIEIGRGVIDIPSVLEALAKIDYQGIVAFEFEKDPDDVVPGLSESVGYIRGAMDMM